MTLGGAIPARFELGFSTRALLGRGQRETHHAFAIGEEPVVRAVPQDEYVVRGSLDCPGVTTRGRSTQENENECTQRSHAQEPANYAGSKRYELLEAISAEFLIIRRQPHKPLFQHLKHGLRRHALPCPYLPPSRPIPFG